ncbi:MAG: molecular chaperone TorD family protein [Sutterella sp.]|nr:molecular chaperone TorD family protein [Sutterella sp.]
MSHLINQGITELLRVFKGPLFHTHQPEMYASLEKWALANNQRHFADCCAWAQAHIDEVEADFNRMCIGPYRLTVPPYESVWRGNSRVMNNRYSAAVAYSYAELGLGIHTGFREMPDFIGNELEFMYCVGALYFAHALEEHDEERDLLNDMFIRFWQEHLGHWVYTFLSQVQADSSCEFWREWARVLGEGLGQHFAELSLTQHMTGMEQPLNHIQPSKDLS